MSANDVFLLDSPSPPSSPAVVSIDSSPPSSPNLAPVATPPASPGLPHPLAGSAKANKRPRLYEKRDRSPAWVAGHESDSSWYTDAYDTDAAGSPDAGRGHLRARMAERSRVQDGAKVVDPFAASAKRSWRPPRRERKLARYDSASSDTFGVPSLNIDDLYVKAAAPAIRPAPVNAGDSDMEVDVLMSDDEGESFSEEQTEQKIWDITITRAIDTADGIIDLSVNNYSPGLTAIPPSIGDLAKLVVLRSAQRHPTLTSPRSLARAATVPAADAAVWTSPGRLPLAKSASFATSSSAPSNEIQLYLAKNAITRLPAELFRLTSLTVLSLRSNALREIPPQIAQLPSLQDVNVSNNRLRWLPAEMLSMHLNMLSVRGNPWLEPPADPKVPPPSPSVKRISPTTVHFTIPPLTELCLRVLLAPDSVSSNDDVPRTVLESTYVTPIVREDVPPAFIETLHSCVPGSVAQPSDGASQASPSKSRTRTSSRNGGGDSAHDSLAGISVCPSPSHHAEGERVPVFVRHAEERFTWERVVAGRDVGAEGVAGAGVPVRWRGCSRGCLDFLEATAEPAVAGDPAAEPAEKTDVLMQDDDDGGLQATLVGGMGGLGGALGFD
ncbi:hypothetical protein OBBRIDRAFT_839510 [Obba rivulosa]|uniref:Uncharacterized protein n=1 Tax=Obba rivulosa TaxID=1052685 RepID=A0A8E2AID6_9APHY|nr:hypothetical protein OBBRIDRAFT_839510 [Obba rivulosa]